jgi:hypothetical protein
MKVRNFKFNGVQVPIHIFISPHATKIHIPLYPIWSRSNSLARRYKIMVIFTRIYVFINKLLKFRSDILNGSTDRISSAINPTIMLFSQNSPHLLDPYMS